MGEQLTPHQQRQAPPTELFPPSHCMEEAAPGDTRHMKRRLDDVTSLVLMAASADRTGGTVGSVASLIAELERAVVERLGSMQAGMEPTYSERPECGQYQGGAATPMPSEGRRSYEHLLLAANSSTLAGPRPRSDLVSLQSAADSNITERPLCMTFDSGIGSPASAIIPRRRPGQAAVQGDSDGQNAAVLQDLQQRLCYLRAIAEARAGDFPGPAAGAQGQGQGQGAATLQAAELLADKTLSSSLMAFENTKLSAEVDYLNKKVEILESIAGTSVDAQKGTMETISIGSQTDEVATQPSIVDEADFSVSDFALTSPETNHLMSTALCAEGDFSHQPSSTSTPGIASSKHTPRRRKIEVPTQLRDFSGAASASYLSINTWADGDDKPQDGSASGCWKGLLTCCYRPH